MFLFTKSKKEFYLFFEKTPFIIKINKAIRTLKISYLLEKVGFKKVKSKTNEVPNQKVIISQEFLNNNGSLNIITISQLQSKTPLGLDKVITIFSDPNINS